MNPDPPVQRVREVRGQLAREGPPRVREREYDFESVSMPERDCDLLRDLLIFEGAQTVVEIGLAYASSALAIGEALVSAGRPKPRHLVIDPFQESIWSNAGWELLRRAGLDAIARLMLAPSSVSLPQLVAEGVVADAAFVDGSHRFHEVFVDLYFLRKLVRPGGLIIVDDYWWPSVRSAVHYYQQQLGWRVVTDALSGGTVGAPGADPGAQPLPRCRALRLPDRSFEPPFAEFRPFGPVLD